MALLACSRSYCHGSGAVQESIGKIAEAQKVLPGADELRRVDSAGGILKIGPVGRDQRLTAVRQKKHELQAGRHAHLSKDLQSLSLKWVMWTRNGDALG
jgi:hypothetical protein